jgi:hypothetical protein
LDDQPAPTPTSASRRELRLRARVAKFAEPGDKFVAWTQGWVAREGRFQWLAARTWDHVVITEQELMLVSTGFFSRRPRRLVYAAALEVLTVMDLGPKPGQHLRVIRPRQRPLRIDLKPDRHSDAVCALLRTRVRVHLQEGKQS